MSRYTVFAPLDKHHAVYEQKLHAMWLNQILGCLLLFTCKLSWERDLQVLSTRFDIYFSYIWFYSIFCLIYLFFILFYLYLALSSFIPFFGSYFNRDREILFRLLCIKIAYDSFSVGLLLLLKCYFVWGVFVCFLLIMLRMKYFQLYFYLGGREAGVLLTAAANYTV